jgi:hypothetical protein
LFFRFRDFSILEGREKGDLRSTIPSRLENSICDFSILDGDEAVCCFGLGSGERTTTSLHLSDVATGYGGRAPHYSSVEVMEYISILPWIEETW